MYTVKILSNTVSENLEIIIGNYIMQVVEKHPGAIMEFQYQALQGVREDIYTCMITVNTGIIAVHYMNNAGQYQKASEPFPPF
jgi:hypothetical protein